VSYKKASPHRHGDTSISIAQLMGTHLGGVSEVVKNPDHPAITLLVSPGSKKYLPKIIRTLEWDIFFFSYYKQ
jgi:hypothetical protein